MVQPAKPNKKQAVPHKELQSPVSNISKIGSLKRFDDRDYARTLLHEMAILVAPVINEYGFKIGTLCEMYPSNANLLGLNVNKGQKILIRLRFALNSRLYYSMSSLIDTLLHELTHNVHGAHDNKFYDFLEKLKTRYLEHQAGMVKTNYRCEEGKLGGKQTGLMREQRLKAVSKVTYVAEVRKLGDGAHVGASQRRISKPPMSLAALREKMLQATERRLKDSKWCSLGVDIEDDDVEIIDMDSGLLTPLQPSPAKTDVPKAKLQPIPQQYKDIIDLTNEEYELPSDEVIVVDACDSSELKSIMRSTVNGDKTSKRVQFSVLLPAFDGATSETGEASEPEELVQYTTSTSPRAYFTDECLYPRKKLVADLNFDQILRKGEKISPRVTQESTFGSNVDTKPIELLGNLKLDEVLKSTPVKNPEKYNPKKALTKSRKARKRKVKEVSPQPVVNKKTVKSINFADLLS